MTVRPQRFLLLWFLLSAAVPAYPNNPPRPDGMLGILLLFPVAILGLRAAGARRPPQSRTRRILEGVVLVVSTVLAAAGTGIAIIPLVILLVYGLLRGVEAMRFGYGRRRWAIGAVIILFALFAVANYLASLSYLPSPYFTESLAVARVRSLLAAQLDLQASAKLDRNGNGVGEFASLEVLQRLDPALELPHGYQFVAEVSGDPVQDEKQFFAYATPLDYGDRPWRFSLLDAFGPRRYFARRTFAVDESGVIRARDTGGSQAVTREETKDWPSVD